MSGTATAIDAVGITLKVENRDVVTAGDRETVAYKATVFVPWSSVLYVKLKE